MKNAILLATWEEATYLASEYFHDEGIVYTKDTFYDMIWKFIDDNNIELIDR